MDITIRKEIGRCHTCGHEYVVLTRKIEHPKELKITAISKCPECNSEDIAFFGIKKSLVLVPEDKLAEISKILLHNITCTKCGKDLLLLTGERADLVFKIKKVLNEAEGLVEEYKEIVPFCKRCMDNESEDTLISVSKAYLEKIGKDYSEKLLHSAKREWRC